MDAHARTSTSKGTSRGNDNNALPVASEEDGGRGAGGTSVSTFLYPVVLARGVRRSPMPIVKGAPRAGTWPRVRYLHGSHSARARHRHVSNSGPAAGPSS